MDKLNSILKFYEVLPVPHTLKKKTKKQQQKNIPIYTNIQTVSQFIDYSY